jgi:hypothetical protein
MKIHQLPQGARFEYEGKEYVKSGPLSGSGKDGQRLIPRYAVLKPLDSEEVGRGPKRSALAEADVRGAFETFYADCKILVPEAKRAALEAARDRFLKLLA